jgi:membrane protein DedA with SNARE-associated domain
MLERFVDLLAGQSLHVGATAVFLVLLLCGFGLPLPEDVVLVTGGVLAWLVKRPADVALLSMFRHRELLLMLVMGLCGILAGDSVIYLAGRRLGTRLAEFPLLRRLVPPQKLTEVEKLIRRRGNVVVMLARFLPGLRAPTYFTVGHSRLPFWEFLAFDGLAALVSAPLWVCLGFYFGSNIQEAAHHASRFGRYIGVTALVVVAFLLFRSWRKRRRARAGRAAR